MRWEAAIQRRGRAAWWVGARCASLTHPTLFGHRGDLRRCQRPPVQPYVAQAAPEVIVRPEADSQRLIVVHIEGRSARGRFGHELAIDIELEHIALPLRRHVPPTGGQLPVVRDAFADL